MNRTLVTLIAAATLLAAASCCCCCGGLDWDWEKLFEPAPPFLFRKTSRPTNQFLQFANIYGDVFVWIFFFVLERQVPAVPGVA